MDVAQLANALQVVHLVDGVEVNLDTCISLGQIGAEAIESMLGNFRFYSYKKACAQKRTVRSSKNSRRLSNDTPVICRIKNGAFPAPDSGGGRKCVVLFAPSGYSWRQCPVFSM